MNTTSTPVTIEMIDAKLRDLGWRTVGAELAKLESDFEDEPDVISSIATIRDQLSNSPASLRLSYIMSQSWPLNRWCDLTPLSTSSLIRYRQQHGEEQFWIYIGKIASAEEFIGWMNQVVRYI